jgi:hypothetical protein
MQSGNMTIQQEKGTKLVRLFGYIGRNRSVYIPNKKKEQSIVFFHSHKIISTEKIINQILYKLITYS